MVASPSTETPPFVGHDLRWLLVASYVTWLVCALPPVAEIVAGRFRGSRAIVWLSAYLLFGAVMTAIAGARAVRQGGAGIRVPLLLIQSITGLVVVYLSGNGTTSALLVIVAAEIPHLVPLGIAVAWVGCQTIGIALVFSRYSWINGITAGIALGGFQMFALASSVLAAREREGRQTLAAANAELLATRARLAESSRAEERLRIARDLHDALGHHLTALSLQLDVASRLADGKAAAHVSEAHAITRLLLSDVRDVVGQMREQPRLALADALRALASTSRDLAVHLTLPPSLALDDETRAQALVRGVQEIITNTVRHARARHLWIEVTLRDNAIELSARDDGRGAAAVAPGHGLTGMRERFEACGGRVEFSTRPDQGFEVRGSIPRMGPPS